MVTESATLSRIKCNHIDTWYKSTGPRYYRMSLGHWTYGKGKWCQVKDDSRLNNLIALTKQFHQDIKLDNIYNHQSLFHLKSLLESIVQKSQEEGLI